jgi:serine/threonine protein phosphatase PrpC
MDITSVSWAALTAAAGTVTGNHYRDNFDAHHLDLSLPLAVLADGMGDGPGSAFASRTAVDRLTHHIREATTPHAPAALRAAVASIHEEVRDFARARPGLAGCTLTAMVPDADGGAWLIQIGDSRAYRLRNDLLELLTVDHTAAWLGLLHGWFDHDSPEARSARYRLTRYIGHPDAPAPDILNEPLAPGDVYLLCTDGVADQLGPAPF